MKYRIKIITYVDGRKIYIPQVKNGFMSSWKYIHGDGSEYNYVSYDCKKRERALDIIDTHYNLKQRNKIKSIEIEYITK
jgi:hypothetical protein